MVKLYFTLLFLLNFLEVLAESLFQSNITSLPNISSLLSHIPEDGRLEFCGLVNKYGLKCKEYEVVTKDGYILKVFRIPGNSKRPVFLMHGIFGSSDDYMLRGNTSLCFLLAKTGYDVWVGNIRGNRYSRRNIHIDPDLNKESFWNFSFDEHALIDLPSMLNFVLNNTEQEKLSYIGFSQGTLLMYALASTKPEYNDKIKIFISLASVCYIQYWNQPILGIAQIGPILTSGLQLLGIEEVAGYNTALKKTIDVVCTQGQISYDVCVKWFVFVLTGANEEENEPEFLPVVVGHFPAGTSRKNLLHQAQVAVNCRFQKFDYGKVKNLALYNSERPPEYDVRKISMNVALFVGKNDNLGTLKTAEVLNERLQNVVRYIVVEPEKWTHLDFEYARNAYKYVYADVLDTLQKYADL